MTKSTAKALASTTHDIERSQPGRYLEAQCTCGWSFSTLSAGGRTHAINSHRRAVAEARRAVAA